MKKYAWFIAAIVLVLSMAACKNFEANTPGNTTAVLLDPTTPPATTATQPEPTGDANVVSITFSREGVESTIPVTMIDGSNGLYRIATNPEIFRMESFNGSDTFWYTLWEGQPNIYYSVSYHADMTTEYMEGGLLHQNDGSTSEKVKIGQYDAIAVYTSKNDQWSTQQHFYLIPHNGGCFLIETQFVMEMYEGLFPQMRAIFDTFEILG